MEINMAGKYKTKQQSAIIDCLKIKKNNCVTVVEIEKYLQENNCPVGVTTIYRHLEKMERDGIVARINVNKHQGACYQYVGSDYEDDCFFIECEDCGKISKMACHHLSELYNHVNADHHFNVNPRKTIFYGKCEKCAKYKEQNIE
jgi:Fur family ferric uptake transcriptional regulator